MDEIHRYWAGPCGTARAIREHFGVASALEYVVGEKFLGFLGLADARPEMRAEIPAFARAVRELFSVEEIGAFLDGLLRAGEVDRTPRPPWEDQDEDEGDVEDELDRVMADAEQVLLVERARELLVG